jgi:hypothetical protein
VNFSASQPAIAVGLGPLEGNSQIGQHGSGPPGTVQGVRPQVKEKPLAALGLRPAAESASLFQDDDLPSAAGEREPGRQPRQSAADNHRVVGIVSFRHDVSPEFRVDFGPSRREDEVAPRRVTGSRRNLWKSGIEIEWPSSDSIPSHSKLGFCAPTNL